MLGCCGAITNPFCLLPEFSEVAEQSLNTTLAFEYSTVDADITGKIDSVLNPSGGIIRADSISELIIEKDKVDPGKTRIICRQDGPKLTCA